MKHPRYIVRVKGLVAHVYAADMDEGRLWAATQSMCGKLLSTQLPSEAGDGRPVCRICARKLVREGRL